MIENNEKKKRLRRAKKRIAKMPIDRSFVRYYYCIIIINIIIINYY